MRDGTSTRTRSRINTGIRLRRQPATMSTAQFPCDAFLLAYIGAGTYTLSITHSGGGGNLTLTTSPYDATCYHSLGPDSCAAGGNGWGGANRHALQYHLDVAGTAGLLCGGRGRIQQSVRKRARARVFSGGHVLEPGVPGPMTLPTALPVASTCTATPSTPGCVLFDETNLETDEMTWALSLVQSKPLRAFRSELEQSALRDARHVWRRGDGKYCQRSWI